MDKLDDYSQILPRWAQAEMKAAESMGIVLQEFFEPKKVVDVGCGLGVFLLPFIERGVEVLGIDGSYPKQPLLKDDQFKHWDLRKPLEIGKYDLAICLEVIEHIQPEYENVLLDTLAKASNVVVFSGAKPGQVGFNHYNCQEKKYWVEQFAKRGYSVAPETLYLLDKIRHWQEFEQCPWLEENIVIFRRDNVSAKRKS